MSSFISPAKKVRCYKRILGLGLPIVGGMISQNIINLVDTAMVGSLGDVALAAVGTGSFIAFMAVSDCYGVIHRGPGHRCPEDFGEGRTADLAVALNAALVVAAAVGVVLSALYWRFADSCMDGSTRPRGSCSRGSVYRASGLDHHRGRINMSFRGYWNGTDRPMLYLRTLVMIHSSNIVLNYLFIFGNLGFPELGTLGAAIGTTASLFMGSVYYFYLGFKHAGDEGFIKVRWSRTVMASLLRSTIPNSLQQAAAGYTVLFWIIGKVGTAETAAANVLVNIMPVAILPSIALGMASTTLVGQAMGRGDPDDAYLWGWDVVRVAFVTLVSLRVRPWCFSRALADGFFTNQRRFELGQVTADGVWRGHRHRWVGPGVDAVALGAGDNKTVMLMSVGAQWFFLLPIAFWVGPVLGWGLLGIWTVQAFYRILLSSFLPFVGGEEPGKIFAFNRSDSPQVFQNCVDVLAKEYDMPGIWTSAGGPNSRVHRATSLRTQESASVEPHPPKKRRCLSGSCFSLWGGSSKYGGPFACRRFCSRSKRRRFTQEYRPPADPAMIASQNEPDNQPDVDDEHPQLDCESLRKRTSTAPNVRSTIKS